MAITNYTDIAKEQAPFANFPGGGMTNQGSPASAGFNDPSLEIGNVKEVIATYTMLGNEAANDLVNIYLAQPGTILDPVNSHAVGNGIATTATIAVGDDDVTGNYVNQNPTTAQPASQSRYSSSINAATNNQTTSGTATQFVGGDALVTPFIIGATAVENAAAGGTISGSWIQLKWLTMSAPVAGKLLVFRLKLIKP